MTTLHEAIEQGRVIRRNWESTDKHGRETACLLAWLSPEVKRSHHPAACPASVMPAWLAHLTPWIDDAPSDDAWPGLIRRYADVAARWQVLDDAAWQRAEYAVRALIVREAMTHTTDDNVLTACWRVADLCDAVAAGGSIDATAFAEASEASEAAAWTARGAAWTAARAARAASEAKLSARASARASEAAEAAARAAAADRIVGGILTIIEHAIKDNS